LQDKRHRIRHTDYFDSIAEIGLGREKSNFKGIQADKRWQDITAKPLTHKRKPRGKTRLRIIEYDALAQELLHCIKLLAIIRKGSRSAEVEFCD
jgi:hypothetical protein